MTFETIVSSIDDHVATLTLHRSEAMNALNRQMMMEVSQCINSWDADPDVRAIVITGSETCFAAVHALGRGRELPSVACQLTANIER